MITFQDPAGNTHELVWGFKSDFIRFNSPVGVQGFITGDQGMGHVVLPLAAKFAEGKKFLQEVMGFEMSDIMNFMPAGPDGPALPIHFMHCKNRRHHSLAIAAMPDPAGCVHMMFEVQDMPEVGRGLDRMAAHGVKLMATLGQHTNDHMISFYMKTPSGFALEYGYNGYTPDWSEHAVHEFTKVSLWGHDFSVGFK
jgi:3,4-dihydroxy-9,10-secoandrosta-1,3,5(10)-triene-9,17-dione 4,5-dioxygenase